MVTPSAYAEAGGPNSSAEVVHVAEPGLLRPTTAVGQPGDHPESHSDDQQDQRDAVLDPVLGVPRPRPDEEGRGHGAEERRPARSAEAGSGAGPAAYDEARDVDDREDAQQQQGGGAAQRFDDRDRAEHDVE